MRIAILGSGVAGLAAAAALQQSGIDYVLFDRDANPLDGGLH
ncbi:NAD(P)-binding protein [Alicyclobacillus sp. TC]|nr:NAD(P)-binding protein [Alicyclobacillus sp. TC]